MKKLPGVHLQDVQAVYDGAEGELWELIMGEQVHIGGMSSSQELAEKAGIRAGSEGVDLCCCNGAGMRFLVLMKNVASMCGVDATPAVIARGKIRVEKLGLAQKIRFIQADVCRTGLAAESVDFVWGEDAWCYVEDKAALAREAARLTRHRGVVAFTDWIEGPKPLSDEEALRFLGFMKFPTLEDLHSWPRLLIAAGLTLQRAEDTGRFAPYCQLYIDMLSRQLTYDALRIIHFDGALLQRLAAEMAFMLELARAGKIAQGLFVAGK